MIAILIEELKNLKQCSKKNDFQMWNCWIQTIESIDEISNNYSKKLIIPSLILLDENRIQSSNDFNKEMNTQSK